MGAELHNHKHPTGIAPAATPLRRGFLQRKCGCGQHTVGGGACDSCSKKDATNLRRAAIGNDSGAVHENEVPAIVHDVLRSPGQPLDAQTRAYMEPRFGHDFSQVRTYHDDRAAESASSVGALAYTAGKSIVFGKSQYSPGTDDGRRLMAHELAHVAQNSDQALQPKKQLSEPTDASEQAADRLAAQVVLDPPITATARETPKPFAGAMIQRYRSSKAQYFGRSDDPGSGMVEQTFKDKDTQPWIEHIDVIFDGEALDTNPDLSAVAAADRLMVTGNATVTYAKNKAKLSDFKVAVGGGSSALGLTDRVSKSPVIRMEGVGYNAALQPGQVASEPRVKGTKYTKDPDPTTAQFTGLANMHWAVFFKDIQALHFGAFDVGSHACVHVPGASDMRRINYHSRMDQTKVTVSYPAGSALTNVCCARRRLTGLKRNPCGSVTCP
ncbi:MAG: DUF4157 domain-containing protein [Pyrinomonadaceae bacterium]